MGSNQLNFNLNFFANFYFKVIPPNTPNFILISYQAVVTPSASRCFLLLNIFRIFDLYCNLFCLRFSFLADYSAFYRLNFKSCFLLSPYSSSFFFLPEDMAYSKIFCCFDFAASSLFLLRRARRVFCLLCFSWNNLC